MANVTLGTTDATWVNDATVEYDAAELRRADAALFAATGIASGLSVSVSGSDTVTVTAGTWVISGEAALSGSGVYRGGIGAAVSGALEARDATNSRIDLVVARQYDPDVVPAHTESAAKVEIIKGTPAASPTAPALPSLAIELARITVPAAGAGAASVDSSRRKTAIAAGGLAAAGTVTVSAIAGTVTQAVSFPTGRFPAGTNVAVTVSFSDGSPAGNFVSPFSVTNTGFTLAVTSDATKNMAVYWIARVID